MVLCSGISAAKTMKTHSESLLTGPSCLVDGVSSSTVNAAETDMVTAGPATSLGQLSEATPGPGGLPVSAGPGTEGRR